MRALLPQLLLTRTRGKLPGVACAAASVAGDDEDQWESPSWCYSKDCPKFAVKETAADGAELREYRPSRWLAANFTDIDYSKAVEKGAEVRCCTRRGDPTTQQCVTPAGVSLL